VEEGKGVEDIAKMKSIDGNGDSRAIDGLD